MRALSGAKATADDCVVKAYCREEILPSRFLTRKPTIGSATRRRLDDDRQRDGFTAHRNRQRYALRILGRVLMRATPSERGRVGIELEDPDVVTEGALVQQVEARIATAVA